MPLRYGKAGNCQAEGLMGISIGIAILLFIVIGFVFYLIKLNRRAKKEQSEVDPDKLRKWDDD